MLTRTHGPTRTSGLQDRREPVEGTEQPRHDDYMYALRDEEAYLHADDDKPQVPEKPIDPSPIVCQFCGKSWEQVPRLFQASAGSWIPTRQPSRPSGSATSASPGWRRSSPNSPPDLDGCGGGSIGHPATPR